MTDSSGNGPEVAFDVDAAQALLDEVTAPWVRELGLQVVEIGRTRSRFHLPFGGALTRDAGMSCGQAIVAAADTAMIAAVTAAIGGYAPITTVDIASRFLRPLGADCVPRRHLQRPGRVPERWWSERNLHPASVRAGRGAASPFHRSRVARRTRPPPM